MQSNKLLFFAIIGVAVIVVIGMFLAGLLLINRNPIELTVLYSSEKEAWLDAVREGFEGAVDGRPIELNFEKMGSREIVLSVLDESKKPHLISPASTLQVSLLEKRSRGINLARPWSA